MPMRLDDFVSQTSTEPAVPDTKNGLEPAKGTRLDDYVSMMPVPAQEPLIEFSDEWREEQKAKGEIGYIETLRRKRKLEMLPAVPAVNSVFLLNAAKRWRRNQYDDDKQKEEDKELLSRFLEKKEEERIRGFSLGGHVARGQVELPAYMLEFALTGGVASLGRAAAAKGVTALATKTAGAEAIKSLAGRATLETAELAASAAVRTTVLPHKWVGSFADRQLNSGLELTEKGIQIADQIGEKPMTSFAKAIGDTYIEFASEETGGMITKGLGKLVPKQFKTALEKLWVRSKPNRTVETVKALWTKAGYHSFIGELGEEQVGDLMRAITGVEDFGAKDPDNMWDRVAKSWHGVDELLVNAGVLALPGGARMASVQLANLIQKRKRMTMTEGPPLQELTDAQADQIMAKKGAGAEEKTGEEGTPPSPQKIAKAQSLDRMIERAQDTTDPLSSELAPLLEDMKLARQQLGEIQPKAQEEVQPPPEAKPEPIGETIKKRLLEAGVSGEVADSQSKLYEASFQTMSERAGIDAVELFNRYGPQITRVDGPTENVPPGTMTAEEFEQASFNALLEKQRQTEGMSAAIKDPQTGELYTGPSHAEILEEAFKTDADLAGRLSEELLNRTENTGFADENLEFVSRQQAERRFGIVNSESLRKSYQQGPAKTSESNAHENKVLTTFGETDDLKKAGFLFPDGKMADFTEKGEERRYTHYDAIEKVLGDENRLYEFLSLTKAVRVVYYSDINGDNVSFQSTAPFTQDQLRQINDYLISNKVAHSNLELVTETGKQIRTKAVDNTAIADIERFFNGSSQMFEQSPKIAPTFFSQAAKTIEEKMPAKAAADQVMGILKNAPGIKQEELEWLGLGEWLKDKKSVTKEEVLEFLKQNNVQIKEVMKGGEPVNASKLFLETKDKNGKVSYVTNVGQFDYEVVQNKKGRWHILQDGHELFTSTYETPQEAFDSFEKFAGERLPGSTKFSKYTLPGGENYRELLLTLPEPVNADLDIFRQELSDKYDRGWHFETLTPDEQKKYKALETKRQPNFHSSHFSEPNILAHVRFNERVDAEGKKTLFLEEIQSDWMQKGREHGFKSEVKPYKYDPATFGEDQHQFFVESNGKKFEVGKGVVLGKVEAEDYLRRLIDTKNAEQTQGRYDQVPNAPFKKTWHELALKRMIRYATENGFDKVAWTTGEQQAERYDLSKQIDHVDYGFDGRKNAMTLEAFKDKRVVISQVATEADLPDLIGKEASRKLIEQPEDRDGFRALSGLDLKVGGEGMKGFYDKIIPEFLNKYTKKWGGRVGTTQIETRDPNGLQATFAVIGEDGRTISEAVSRSSAERTMAQWPGSHIEVIGKPEPLNEVHSLDITPAMKESVLQGQPLFQGGEEQPRANIQFGDMGVLINLFKTADKSSILHETGHLYLKMMGELSALPTATEGLKTDAATLLKWLGAKSFEAIEREQHEKFARGFEAYLREGKAPTSELRQAFENFREWLLSIYKSIKDLKVELTPEVRGIFDRMLATQEEIEKSGLVTEERFKISELKKQMKDRDLDIQAFKQSIVDYANRYLYKEERGSLLATVKNAKTLTDLDQAVQRIDEMAETSAKETLLSKIETELEKTKVKKQSGKPVGTFTPDIQEILDSLRRFSSVDAFSAQEQIAKNLTAHADGVLPDEILLENKLLDLAGGLESKSSEDLAKVLETIKDIKRSGRALSELKDTERKKKISQAVDNFVKEITGQKGLASGTGTFGVKDVSKPETVAEAIKTFGRDLTLGWNDFLSILSGKSGVRSGQSFIELFGKVFNETRAEESAIGQANEKLRDMVSDSYGVKEEAKLLDILRESNRPVNLGRFTNAGGIEGDLVLTKAQAQKKWAELQDPSLKETFDSPEGMAYTQEIQDAIENFLSPEDKAFVKRAMKFFKEYYNTINPVYREMYGVNLPFNEFYTPIRRVDGGAETLGGFGEFIQEINVRRSVAPGGVKSRVKNIKPLELTSLPEVMQKHIAEMEHFKVWANKIRDLNAVFGNAKVKRAIQETYGSGLYKSVFNFIEDFTRGGSDKSKAIRFLDQWRIRTTQVALAARPAILIKQLASIPAYWDAMTTKDFTLGVLDFWKNPVENIKILKQSDFLKFRGQNIDRDIKAALDSEAYKAFRKTDSFINRLMLNVQLGDQGSIIVGGWAVYKRALNQGKTHEQALKEFAEVSNASQQSGDLSEQSGFQRGGSLAKMFTMFMTSPNQYLRKEMGAIRNYRNGRITAKEAAKTLFIFHFFLPMLFQWVSDFGRFDPKEQLRAAIFGSLNGLFIVGDLLEALLRRALGLKVYDNELPILSVPFKDIKDLLFSIDWHSIEDEDVKKALDGALGVTGFATRIPLKQVKDMLASVTDVYEGNYREGIGGMLGWSEHALKEKTDDESTSF